MAQAGALGRIRVPSAKAPEEFCGGKRVFFTWSRHVPVLCPTLNRERVQQSCYVRAWFVRTNMRTYLPRCA